MVREGPYRQPATVRQAVRPPLALARQALALAFACLVLLLLAAPVVVLAIQPVSLYATLVAGTLAAWSGIALVRIGCKAA